MVFEEQYLGVAMFFGILMIISWVLSCHWAKKYFELKRKIEEKNDKKTRKK